MRIFFFIIALLLVGCTDAGMGKFTALGNKATVMCWSGDTVIFNGRSTGKVRTEENSDGYFFVDSASKQTVEVSGNCVIKYDR